MALAIIDYNSRDVSVVRNARKGPMYSIPFFRKSMATQKLLVGTNFVGGASIVEKVENGVIVPSFVLVQKLLDRDRHITE